MGDLILSLFPGADLLGLAFESEGFTVVQGPDVIFGRDIRNFHVPPGRFDGVIGGPPCQAFSRLRHIVQHNGYQTAPNLIPEFERCIAEAQPEWFLMENVPDAPIPMVSGYTVDAQLVEDVAVGGATMRKRRFSFGARELRWLHVVTLALWSSDPEPAVVASGPRTHPVKFREACIPKHAVVAGRGRRLTVAEVAVRQGLPADFLADAPFTASGKVRVMGQGVPLPMGRAIARAVKAALAAEVVL